MKNTENLRTRLKANGWDEPQAPEIHHQNTGDIKIIEGSNAYLVLQQTSSFQTGVALFDPKNMVRLRLYNLGSGDFNWLQIEFGENLDSFLDQLIGMQMELPSKHYFSLMGGAFSQEIKVSLLAWEQFI